MPEYTPTTGEVRLAYAWDAVTDSFDPNAAAAFDRRLAAHDAEVIAGQQGGVDMEALQLIAQQLDDASIRLNDRQVGDLAAQIAALRPSVSGERRVILAREFAAARSGRGNVEFYEREDSDLWHRALAEADAALAALGIEVRDA